MPDTEFTTGQFTLLDNTSTHGFFMENDMAEHKTQTRRCDLAWRIFIVVCAMALLLLNSVLVAVSLRSVHGINKLQNTQSDCALSSAAKMTNAKVPDSFTGWTTPQGTTNEPTTTQNQRGSFTENSDAKTWRLISKLQDTLNKSVEESQRHNQLIEEQLTVAKGILESIDNKTDSSDAELTQKLNHTYALLSSVQTSMVPDSHWHQAIGSITSGLKQLDTKMPTNIATKDEFLSMRTSMADIQGQIGKVGEAVSSVSQKITDNADQESRMAEHVESFNKALFNLTETMISSFELVTSENGENFEHFMKELFQNRSKVLNSQLLTQFFEVQTLLSSSLISANFSSKEIIKKMDSQLDHMDNFKSSLSSFNERLKNLSDLIQAVNTETAKSSGVQFCSKSACKVVFESRDKIPYRCFKIVGVSATWNQAKQNCQNLGGYLAEIFDHETQSYILGLNPPSVWLGATDHEEEGSWRWDHSGVKMNMNFWRKGQPDNWRGSEHCMHISPQHSGNWNDINCEAKLPYLCEKYASNCDDWV